MSSKKYDNSDNFDFLEIALRAYVPTGRKPNKWRGSNLGPSDWTVIFDTETTTDASQTLKFGVYQIRKGQELWEAGFFTNPEILTNREISVIHSFAAKINYKCMTIGEFVENVLFRIAYNLRATIVGFNLPFDISRIAIGHGAARGRIMKGGFSFQLSPHRYWPNIQIKHLSARVSLIRFTTRPGRIAGRGMRKRKIKILPRPGFFVDIRTLAAALFSRSFNLAGLADFLKTAHRKLDTDEHGGQVTDNYLSYARNDVQATWECYCKLLDKYSEHKFTKTAPHRIFSEASIGKAYFRQMNIQPWRVLQPDFPDYLIGIIMSGYFGGRSEVHHRRINSQVRYCDFLSMYPTVCTLMRLWQFVIANGLKWQESTDKTSNYLNSVTLRELQDRNSWRNLETLVQIAPDADIVPIRANYGGEQQSTIGLNYLEPDVPQWFTLADCIASKLLTGKAPKVLRAITFEPDGVQCDLKPVEICGNPEYRIDPYTDDFYCRIIDLRSAVKLQLKTAASIERATLESTQQTIKILANATSYGNFVELNVEDLSKPEQCNCYGYSGEPFTIETDKIEDPGRYFHPLIGTLITGAARLMLAIAERFILDNGLDWAFCDTDSMAIAKPIGMNEAEFNAKVEAVRSWFNVLNPYAQKGPLLKLEDVNFKLKGGKPAKETQPLYCFAVSAKRYALFNLSPDGQISIRKASAHGLGHLLLPYTESQAPTSIPAPAMPLSEIGVERWQYDLWHQIIRTALDAHPDQVNLDYHLNLDLPAASRYGATTPNLASWFDKYNEGRSYSDQVRPSNFMLAYQISPVAIHECPEFLASITESNSSQPRPIKLPKPVAPFDRDPATAAKSCFDRDTGISVPTRALKTYKNALAQYHLRPEHKFLNGNYTDRGITKRRHVKPAAIRHIGKESNRWEEKFYLGNEEGAEINYGLAPHDSEAFLDTLRTQIVAAGQRKIARESGISRRTLARFMQGDRIRSGIITRLVRAAREMQNS
jgi:hypothetical protein